MEAQPRLKRLAKPRCGRIKRAEKRLITSTNQPLKRTESMHTKTFEAHKLVSPDTIKISIIDHLSAACGHKVLLIP